MTHAEIHPITARTTDPSPAELHRALARRRFATLATTSPHGQPHVAGVLYEVVGSALVINTRRGSRKARNIAAEPRVGLHPRPSTSRRTTIVDPAPGHRRAARARAP